MAEYVAHFNNIFNEVIISDLKDLLLLIQGDRLIFMAIRCNSSFIS